jgi:tripartite-type tricarboxylate transporter receptor subunit TctC
MLTQYGNIFLLQLKGYNSMMNRRDFTRAALLASCLPLLPGGTAWAETVMKVLVGFPPGPGGFDFVARQVVNHLPGDFGRTAIVENRAGASSRIALDALKAAKPDGETIMLVSQSPLTIFPYIYNNLRFDPVADFTPISRAVTFDYTITVGPAAPVKTLAEFIAWYKSNPDKALYASPGTGTTPHFIGEALNLKLGISATHVPYKGGSPAITDLLAGQVPVQFDTVSAAIDHHRAGKLRILATLGPDRSPLLPEVPTLKESGIDIAINGWCGFYGPAGMDAAIVEKYNKAIGAALANPNVKAGLERVGMSPAPSSPGALAALQREEREMWGPIIKASGFKAED